MRINLIIIIAITWILTGCGGGSTGSTSNTTPRAIVPTVSSYSLGGTITSASGVSPNGLVLTDGVDNVTITGSASSFTFPTSMSSSTAYTVSVKTNPGGVDCAITNGTGSGTISTSNVNSVTVNCAAGTVSALYTFKTGTNNTTGSANSNDGANSYAGLVMDSLGNLYGTTANGGTAGKGTIFKLTPNSSGSYTETVLYSFQSGVNTTVVGTTNDGAYPDAGLAMDSLGNLYGTTDFGGTANVGTVFKLTNNSGVYTESVIYSFLYNGTTNTTDGARPVAGLVMDSLGNLYGTTTGGGTANVGTVFKLTNNSGVYTESVLYSFVFGTNNTTGSANPNDGAVPYAGLVMDNAGNLYGTTTGGGTVSAGTIFKLTLNPSSGGYTESVLYSFQSGVNTTVVGTTNDGANPQAQLVIDSSGNLYGTTVYGGGSANGGGTVFKLTPNSSGGYTESVLYSFVSGTNNTTGSANPNDGADPQAGLVMDSLGNLYGTTYFGGTAGAGAVFKLTLNPSSSSYTESILANGSTTYGSHPYAGLIMDSSGNLYGTTSSGGAANAGTVFKIN